MSEQPDETTLQRAVQRAQERRRSVYVYRDATGWRVADRVGEAPGGSRILEIPYDGQAGETRNCGGC